MREAYLSQAAAGSPLGTAVCMWMAWECWVWPHYGWNFANWGLRVGRFAELARMYV